MPYIPFYYVRKDSKFVWLTWSKSYVNKDIIITASYAVIDYKNSRKQVDDYVHKHFFNNYELVNYMPIGPVEYNDDDFFHHILYPNYDNLYNVMEKGDDKYVNYLLPYIDKEDVILSCIESGYFSNIIFDYIKDVVTKEIFLLICKTGSIKLFMALLPLMEKEDYPLYIKACGKQLRKLSMLKYHHAFVCLSNM